MKIRAIAKYYFGYLQGYKVYINDKKYPLKYAHFYTALNKNDAINNAINDAKNHMRSL